MSEYIIILIAVFAASWLSNDLTKRTPEYKLGELAVLRKEQCEAELPRNQSCEIIAVPIQPKAQ